jgi:tRNA(fMet)-specific endonuclease VapC
MRILDTDHLTVLEWANSPAALTLQSKMASVSADELGTTVVNFEEQMRGWMSFLSKAKKMADQIEGYRRLKRRLELYCSVSLLPFDERAAVTFQTLRKEHRRIGVMDLKVAAVALANDATLLTCNLRDFQQIPGLKVEDWTK